MECKIEFHLKKALGADWGLIVFCGELRKGFRKVCRLVDMESLIVFPIILNSESCLDTRLVSNPISLLNNSNSGSQKESRAQ